MKATEAGQPGDLGSSEGLGITGAEARSSMNVYAIKAYGHYGGGMAVVAADSEDEAKALAEKAEASSWRVRYGKPESVELLPCACAGPSRVLAHYETGE